MSRSTLQLSSTEHEDATADLLPTEAQPQMEEEMRDAIEQIEAAMGHPVIVQKDQRYNGPAFTALVDDFTAQVRRGFDASTEAGAVEGLLSSLTKIYPERFAPVPAIAAE